MFKALFFFKKNGEGKGKILLVEVALMTILQPSSRGFELCALMLQG